LLIYKDGQIRANTKEIMNMVKNKEKEFIHGPMGYYYLLLLNYIVIISSKYDGEWNENRINGKVFIYSLYLLN
jgi:hypothetical protein